GKVVVEIFRLFAGEVLAHVFHDQRSFANRPRGVATIGVNARLAKDERHNASFNFSTRGTGEGKRQVSALSSQFQLQTPRDFPESRELTAESYSAKIPIRRLHHGSPASTALSENCRRRQAARPRNYR